MTPSALPSPSQALESNSDRLLVLGRSRRRRRGGLDRADMGSARNIPGGPAHRVIRSVLDETDSLDVMNEERSSRNSSISTASTLPPALDHPVIWEDNFLVYFEPRDFHKSNLNKSFRYQGSSLDEIAACNIILEDLMGRAREGEPVKYLDCAMRYMLNAIATVDKERAINIEESNDTTDYRTLSTVLRCECLDRDLMVRISGLWKAAAQSDRLIGHRVESMPQPKIKLLAEITFTHSAPMLSWTMDLPIGWYQS